MTDIRTIIEEAIGSTPTGTDCPHCGAVGSVVTPKGANEAICKKCGKPVINNEIKEKDMEPTNPNGVPSHTKSDVFERLVPMQLKALMETLIRNKKQFDALYSALASEGFVPMNESADYDSKRAVLSEMLKDGAFTKHMLETLVEMNHLEVDEGRKKKSNSKDDDEGEEPTKDTTPEDLEGGDDDDIDDKEPKPEELGDVPVNNDDEEAPKIDLSQVGKAKETINVAQMTLDEVMAKLMQYARDFGFDTPKEVKVKAQDENGNEIEQMKTLSPLSQLVQHYNNWKKWGKAKPIYIRDSKTGQGYLLSSEDQTEYLEDIRKLMEKGKEETSKKHMAQKAIKPPVRVPISQPIEVDETKNKQLNMGTGQSELQLRAGAKGKIFESRIKKLEPYKKIALLEFLENDPKMVDDKDYSDMSTLTGICEEELVLIRMEYENKSDETITEAINYPVFGGQDVRGQNEKNAKKQQTRDLEGAETSQKTTEEKVFQAKKFRLKDLDKSSIENTDKQDQNRGQHSLVAVLNDKDGSQKEKYEAQADGYPSAANKKMHDEMPDSRARDGGKASEREDADVGGELLKKGEEQEIERQNEPIYPKEQVPTTGGKEKPRKMVAEDIDRIKDLFSYDAGTYIKPKAKATAEKVFEQQLKDMRVLSESVDTSDRPTKQQLMEMTECEYQGRKVRTDGVRYFDEEGCQLGECGAMEEGAPDIPALKTRIASLEQALSGKENVPSASTAPLRAELSQLRAQLQVALGSAGEQHPQQPLDASKTTLTPQGAVRMEEDAMEEARGHQLEAGQEIDPKQLYAGTRAKDFASREFDMNKLNEGKDTGKVCTECGHKIWEVDGKKKCMCKGEPTEECSDPMAKETNRMKKLSGMDEAKRLQLKHSKGLQLKTGTKEEIVDEAKRQQLKHSKGHQLETGTKKEEDVIDEAKHQQLKHSKGTQLKTGTKTAEEEK